MPARIFTHLVALSLALSSLVFPCAADASGFSAFGPRVYVRHSGNPVTEVESFTAAVTGSYTLQIYNGGLEDDEHDLVSSSVIYLNGVLVLSPNELNQNISYVEKSVTLQAVNEISAEVRGKPGGALVLNIEGIDSISPTISADIFPPANVNGWHSTDPTVSFNCFDVGSAVASCSEPVTVSTEGADQVITGNAVDLAGNTAATSVTVNIDKTPPELAVTGPPNGITVTDQIIGVTGQIKDAVSTALGSVNGQSVVLDTAGNFDHPVALSEGQNSIIVEAVDAAGAITTVSVQVYLQSNQAPVANAQAVSTPEDVPANIVLTASDADGGVLNYQLVSQPSNGVLSGSAPNLLYLPNPNFSGSDQFTFVANDGALDSDIATVSMTVSPVNDVPVAVAQSLVTPEDSPLAIILDASDVDVDALTYTVTMQPANGTLSGMPPAISYQPNLNFFGSDQFGFTASDGELSSAEALIRVDVAPVNDFPVISSTPVTSGQEGRQYSYQLEADDTEGSALTYVVVTGPVGMSIDASGLVSWIPQAVDVGTNPVTLSVTDVDNGIATQSYDLVIDVAPNTAPTIDSTPITLATVGQDYRYTISASDPDGDSLTYSATTLPIGMNLDALSGALTWTPGQVDIGAHLVSVKIDDGNGGVISHDYTLVATGTDLADAAYMGTEFWIPRFNRPPETQLVISSEVNSSGTVEILALQAQGTIPFTVQAGQITTINVPRPLLTGNDNGVPSGIRNWAMNIQSDDPISVRAIYYNTAATDALLGFPVRALGTDYRIATFGGSPTGLHSRAVIIADQDNTQVTFSAVQQLQIEGVTVPAGEQYTITLNRGEDFHLKPDPTAADLSGTGISADKPIGVYSGHDCAFIPRGGISWCNRTVDQLPSTDQWQTSYLAAPMRTRYGDLFQVIAAFDNTEVSVNGTFDSLLNDGEFTTFQLNDASEITATQPILVLQYSNGLGWDQNERQADPFWDLKQLALNKGEFWAADQFIEIDPAPSPNYAFVLMPEDNIDELMVDGVQVDPNAFGVRIRWDRPLPYPENLRGVQIALSPGLHRFSAPVEFALYKNAEGLYNYADPSMAVVPAVDTYLSAYAFQTPSVGIARHFINITVPTSAINDVILDGRPVDPNHFSPLGATSYSFARLGVSYGGHYVSASEPFGLLVYGFDDADAYMYPGGWAFNQTEISDSVTVTSDNATPIVNGEVCLDIAALTGAGEPIPFAQIDLTISGANPHQLRINASQNGAAQHCYTGIFPGIDQIRAQSGAARQGVQVEWLADAGNDAPAITSAPVVLAADGGVYSYNVTAFDADGDSLTFALLDGPVGMNVDPLNGLVSWSAVSGTYAVSIEVTDIEGSSARQDYQLQVNRVPVLDLLPVNMIVSNYQYVSRVTATDADGDELYYAIETGNADFVIDSRTGEINSYGALPMANYPITISISDRKGGVIYYSYTLVVSGINSAPVLSPSQTSFTVSAGDVLNIDLNLFDADGDEVLVSIIQNALFDFTVEPTTGIATWDSNLADVGSNQVTVIARDEWGAESALVVLDLTATDNLPPVVTSSAPAVVYADTLYEYQIIAIDPENRPLTFEVIWYPGFAVNMDKKGLVSIVSPSYAVGSTRTMRVRITDSAGHQVDHEFMFEVREPNLFEPQLDSGVPNQAIVGYPLNYQLVGSDGDGAPVIFSLISGPNGMTVSTDGLIQWTPEASQVGFQPIVVRLSDGERALEVNWQIETLLQPLPLVVNILVEPQFIELGESATLTAQVVGGIDPDIDSVLLDGAPIMLVAGQATLSPNVVGRHPIVVKVLDDGAITSFTSFVSVTDPSDVDAPTVAIESPAEGDTVTMLTDVIGTVQDANLVDVYLYAHRVGGDDRIDLYRGTEAFASQAIAPFDPTLLRNGQYQIVLQATDVNNQTAAVQTTVVVEGGMKVGNFSITIEDLNIPVAGIPIQVTRTYDSRRRHEALDFGYGWSVDYQNVTVDESTEPSVDWNYEQEIQFFTVEGQPTPFPATCMRSPLNKTVTVTLPNDDVEEFKVRLRGVTGSLISDNDPDCDLTASTRFDLYFDPVEGTTSTLEAYDNTNLYLNGEGNLVDDIIEVTPSSVTKYRLTMKEGYIYYLDQGFGVESVVDPNGNTLTYSDSGITHSSGKAIIFNRDIDGRIDSIVDPMGNEITYGYSTQGDLVMVTDRVGNTSTFESVNDHYLSDLYDALGRKLLKNFYDDDGRLTAQQDADGNRTEFLHDLGARSSIVTDRLGRITQYGYNERGNVVSEVDALGILTAYTFDDNDNQLSKTDAFGSTSSATYDDQHNQLTQTDKLGRVTSFTYNEFGKEVDITDPKGNTYQNGYDTVGNLISISDPDGNLLGVNLLNSRGLVARLADTYDNFTNYTYDGDGNKLTETDALGNSRTFTYDDNGNVLSETIRRTVGGVLTDEITTFEYDDLDRLIGTTDALGNVSQHAYDAVGNKVQDTDALGRVTTYTYDAYRRVIRTDYPDGSSVTMTYDAEGNLLTETDANGNVTSYEYDVLNRVTRTTHADGSSMQTAYDVLGRVLTETDELGNVTTYTYDAAGQRTSMTDALGNVTTYTYDVNGNLATMTDARGNSWQYAYDVYDNRIITTWPDLTTSSEVTDRLGRVTGKTDQNGNSMSFAYDALGRLLTVADALGNATAYSYDEVGNKLTQTDALGRTTSWTYDALGRELTRTLPLGQQESHQYDGVGNRTQSIDFDGQVTSFAYDSRDRLASVTYHDAKVESFTYDNHGNRIGANDRAGDNQSWTFDNRHRLTRVMDVAGNQIDYQYDFAGNKTQQTTTPAGATTIVTSYAYDALNRLQSVTDANALTTSYAYDANGNRASVTYPNGNTTAYVYDVNNRLNRQTTEDSSTAVITDYQYTLDPSGHRLRIDEPGRNTVFTYDASYKLLTEDITDPVNGNHNAAYEYDAVGNRTYSTINGVQTMYTYDANDRLLQQGGEVFSYDDNGNTLTRTVDGFLSTYAYDAKNHLAGAQLNDAGSITATSYRYDVDGIRIQKTDGGDTTDYLIDPNHEHAQVIRESADSAVNIGYLYGDDLIRQSQASTNERYYLYDGLGSTRLLSNGVGAITDTYDYEAFGSVLNQTGITENSYQFTGEQYDSALDQYYLRARYYDQNTGRFTQMDTWMGNNSDPLSLHKYLYSGSDPANHVDPSGHFFSLSEVQTATNIAFTLAAAATAAQAIAQSLESGWDAKGGPSAVQTGWLVLSAAMDLNSTMSKFITAKARARDKGKAAVIGESMIRVMAYANAIGAEYWKIPDDFVTLEANKKWINRVMDRELAIMDIGPSRHTDDYPLPSSQNYLLELEEIAKRNYPKHYKLY